MTWQEELKLLPFIRITVPLIIGIILQINSEFSTLFICILLGLFSIIFVVFHRIKQLIENFRLRHLHGIIISVLFVFVGMLIVNFHKQTPPEIPSDDQFYMVELTEIPIEKENSYKSNAHFVAIKYSNSTWNKLNGNILLYFEKDSSILRLEIGDKLLVNIRPDRIKQAGNPHEFNYKRYLELRNIFYQAYLKKDDWKYISKSNDFSLKKLAAKVRQKLLTIYKENGLNNDEFAVAAALTLGYKNDLDDQLRMAFAASGAMHVLAVSGLHVGIIYFILNFLFRFLDRKQSLRILKAIIIISILTFFAFLTGLSPSVNRAVLMFSFIIISDVGYKSKNTYNILAFSAFVLLFYNPFMLLEVGFQLSYLAVISILYFQPRIDKLFYTKHKIGQKIWALLAVSIAAQIGTFPIGLHYFHQFANYFWLTNLVVIPLATIIVYLGATVFVFSFYEPVAVFFTLLLKYTIKSLNYSVVFIEKLPFSTTSGVGLGKLELIAVYLLIISIAVFLFYKKRRSFYVSLSIITIMLLFSISQNLLMQNRKQFIVYNMRKQATVHNFIFHKTNLVLSNTDDLQSISFAAQNHWTASQAAKPQLFSLSDSTLNNDLQGYSNFFYKNGFVQFFDKRFFFLKTEDFTILKQKQPIYVDYLVLSNNPRQDLADILTFFSPRQIICDASNTLFRENRWKQQNKQFKIPFYSVRDSGAFILEF